MPKHEDLRFHESRSEERITSPVRVRNAIHVKKHHTRQ